MSKKLVIVVLGLLVLYASPGWAGSMGNGAAQRRAAAGLPPEETKTKTQYAFCYAGNRRVVYFTQIITLAPDARRLGEVGYAHYIQKTYGLPTVGIMRCVSVNAKSDAVAEEQRYKESLGKTRFVDIKWDGNYADAH